MIIRKNIAISESGFLFDPMSGESYSLNEQGSLIINLIREGRSEKEIIEHMTDIYEVDREDLERYFIDFIGMLKQFSLIEPENEKEA